ncbi:hypothetical protein XENOCAPTIV_029290 [Xenoophorus captivus]|uniref:Inositol-polyphosphate 5-phosphatase n=1 Tax=Xenoophorus captivus TaxID=1517983 RepID=A0ABV0RWG3_9TELE
MDGKWTADKSQRMEGTCCLLLKTKVPELCRITDQRYEKLPYFLFGDFNFRLDFRSLIESYESLNASLLLPQLCLQTEPPSALLCYGCKFPACLYARISNHRPAATPASCSARATPLIVSGRGNWFQLTPIQRPFDWQTKDTATWRLILGLSSLEVVQAPPDSSFLSHGSYHSLA